VRRNAAIGGGGMAIGQALSAFRLFTGREPDATRVGATSVASLPSGPDADARNRRALVFGAATGHWIKRLYQEHIREIVRVQPLITIAAPRRATADRAAKIKSRATTRYVRIRRRIS
jgi:hypothetical protein